MVARFRTLLLAALVMFSITLARPQPAGATSVLHVDVATHLLDSSAVVQGVVGASKQSQDPETGRPFVDTAVRVTELLWGSAPAVLSVRQHKGTVGDMHFGIPGDGDLKEGQRVVLFVNEAGGAFWLAALGQSVFDVRGTGPDAGLSQQVGGLTFFTRDETGAVVPLGAPRKGPATLGALKEALAAGEDR